MAALIELGDISRGLDLGSRSHLVLVGGGGKTTVMHALGRTLPGRIVLTTTVKMGADQHGGHRVLLDPAVDEVVDTTGAGDLFAAGFLHGLARGVPLPVCGELGSLAAGEAISHLGPRPQVALTALTDGIGV